MSEKRSTWRDDILECIDRIPSRKFTLDDLYAFEPELQKKYPLNHHITDKIRQQLQLLRDEGYIAFLEPGIYQKLKFESAIEEDGLQALQEEIKQFCVDRDWDQFHNPKDLAIGISTEANELLDIFRFKTPEQMAEMLADQATRERISDELADVLFFLLRFSQMNDFDLVEALEKKLAKNNAKYPAEKVRGNNKKYTEYR